MLAIVHAPSYNAESLGDFEAGGREPWMFVVFWRAVGRC